MPAARQCGCRQGVREEARADRHLPPADERPRGLIRVAGLP